MRRRWRFFKDLEVTLRILGDLWVGLDYRSDLSTATRKRLRRVRILAGYLRVTFVLAKGYQVNTIPTTRGVETSLHLSRDALFILIESEPHWARYR